MNKAQFEHAVRAAGAILGDDKVLVIGSQAIHASIDLNFKEAERSIELDVSSLEDPDGRKADLIDGSIGELSMFQETFGYYAQGVTPETATLPEGWRDRLIPYLTPGTNGVTAYCLEPHDLWISKAVAGRPKDKEFCQALMVRNLVETDLLRDRLELTEGLSPAVRKMALNPIDNQ
ncbi:MAG: hypothetical protein GY875_16575 [Gammaproteobacteria bacterium]|nr:hypothetical protein [Gammaproteobacteria bacterium]